MPQTETPWIVKRANGVRNGIYIVSSKPLFQGSLLAVRVAKMCKLKGLAGDEQENAELIVTAVNAWSDPKALQARIAELARGAA